MSIDDKPAQRRGVIALMERDGKYLVITRSQTIIAPGAVCFPGGGIEDGETPEEALKRECREELGVSVHSLRFFTQSVTPWNVHLRWYFAALDGDAVITANPAEVAAVQWMPLDEIRQCGNVLESNLPIIDQLMNV